jgi:hypothetical protein
MGKLSAVMHALCILHSFIYWPSNREERSNTPEEEAGSVLFMEEGNW